MANKERGEVEVTIKGSPHIVRFSTNAQCGVEADLNNELSFLEMVQSLEVGLPRVSWMRALVKNGLGPSLGGLSLVDAGDLIDDIGVGVLMPAVAEAMTAAYSDVVPGAQDPASPNPPAAQAKNKTG